MKRFSQVLAVVALLMLPAVSLADIQVFSPGSPGVWNAMNSGGFFVSNIGTAVCTGRRLTRTISISMHLAQATRMPASSSA